MTHLRMTAHEHNCFCELLNFFCLTAWQKEFILPHHNLFCFDVIRIWEWFCLYQMTFDAVCPGMALTSSTLVKG